MNERIRYSVARLFSAGGLSPPPAWSVHSMGRLRSPSHRFPPGPPLASYRLPYLGILTEVLWPCPLTLLENWLEAKAGVQPYQGGFLLHYLDKLVYPDISATVLTVAGVLVCALNLTLYGRQSWIAHHG
jgi:hypothetical protein